MSDDYYDDPDYDDFEDPDDWDIDDMCDHCGPWCEHWGGDGLCMLVLQEQGRQRKHYHENHVRDSTCPVCGAELEEYDVYSRDGELWSWNPEFYDVMIGLEVYTPYFVPKGELHHEGDVYHVWMGTDENRTEKLIKVLRELPPRTFECGAPVWDPPYPECCTLLHGSKCQRELREEPIIGDDMSYWGDNEKGESG